MLVFNFSRFANIFGKDLLNRFEIIFITDVRIRIQRKLDQEPDQDPKHWAAQVSSKGKNEGVVQYCIVFFTGHVREMLSV